MSETDVVQRVRQIALEEAQKSAANEPGTVRISGNNNVKYNTSYYGHEVSGPDFKWCVVFIWWVMRKAGVPATVFPKLAGVFLVRDFFRDRHRFEPASSMPRVGDLVVFKTSHIGIVENVQSNTIFTVEGNASDMVRRRSYSRDNTNIDGYCRPAYEMVKEEDMPLNDADKQWLQKEIRDAVNQHATDLFRFVDHGGATATPAPPDHPHHLKAILDRLAKIDQRLH
jgi:hypothetical protein